MPQTLSKATLLRRASERDFYAAALEQAVAHGLISLPSPFPFTREHYESLNDFKRDRKRHMDAEWRHGRDTVLFTGRDECDYPVNAPELATFLRARSARLKKQATHAKKKAP